MALKKKELKDIVNTALAAVAKSNDILMKHWQTYHDRKKTNMEYTIKEDLSPVTQLDFEVEKTILDTVLAHYPEHEIIGEEFGKQKNKTLCVLSDSAVNIIFQATPYYAPSGPSNRYRGPSIRPGSRLFKL